MSSTAGEGVDRDTQALQLDLAGVVKGLHESLRKKLRAAARQEDGSSAAERGDDSEVWSRVWAEHCDDKEQLEKYSQAMRGLACSVWKSRGQSRLSWCVDTCREYFRDADGGLRQMLRKEHRRGYKNCDHEEKQIDDVEWLTQMSCHTCPCSCDVHQKWYERGNVHGGIRLLDVGSCYNPFAQFDGFAPLAIDLHPAEQSTHECDFIRLSVSPSSSCWSQLPPLESPVRMLPRHAYHCVVFCLFLSYLPLASQRWLCCVKAYDLLMPNGLFVITTPDSSHAGRHAQLMKSWKLAIEQIGFKRWRYEKLEHLHCMAFRRLPDSDPCRARWRSQFTICHSPKQSTSIPHCDDAISKCQDNASSMHVVSGDGDDAPLCDCSFCTQSPAAGQLPIPQDSSALGDSDSECDVYASAEPRTDEQDTELAQCFDELPTLDSD
ncbi:S-adenosylmethionine sensor upstream of mTORC1-like isoform X1 [Sycon ciliatum]|uniref:S-adenosylmethionine sensor upstream of mTORC1-like isoform X1 n=1 Tax=Sycon ciliatum TaxID=27933 RepID=UPI0031F5FBF7